MNVYLSSAHCRISSLTNSGVLTNVLKANMAIWPAPEHRSMRRAPVVPFIVSPRRAGSRAAMAKTCAAISST